MLARIDTTAIRNSHPILSIISRDVELFETKEDVEYRGGCPFCQTGTDRFVVFPHGAGVGKFSCRVCQRKGDVLDYIQAKHSLNFIDAVKFLEGNPAQTLPQKSLQRLTAVQLSGNDLEVWQSKLELVTQRSMEFLLYSDGAKPARRWLASRGIDWYAAAHFGLGYNDHWQTIIEGYKLPPGVLLPRWNSDIEVIGINVYLSREARELFNSRRAWVKGSQPKAAMFNGFRAETADTVMIFEGELDACLAWRFLSPQANQTSITCATGGASIHPTDISQLHNKQVTICPDNDAAGQSFADHWKELLPDCFIKNVPDGYKDLTDFYQNGDDISSWLN